MNNLELLEEIANAKSWNSKTYNSKKTALQQYCSYHNMTLQEFLDEAYEDEDNRVPYHKLRIRDRIYSFIMKLKEDGKSYGTIRQRYIAIKIFYDFYSVRIPNINMPNGKQFKNNPKQQIGYNDIITKEEIRKVCDIADQQTKTAILLGASGGFAFKELSSLTIRNFTEGTQEYHQLNIDDYETEHEYILNIIKKLMNTSDDIICQFDVIRSKVAKNYTTFCTDEASREVLKYLNQRAHKNEKLKLDSKLLCLSNYLVAKLEDFNDLLNLGKAGRYNKLSTHMIRRFFATTMSNSKDGDFNDIMPDEYIDLFEGRSKGKVNAVYIKKDPESLKKIYMKFMHKVIIYDDHEENRKLSHRIDDLQTKIDEYKELDEKVAKIEDLLKSAWSTSKKKTIDDFI